MGWKFDLVRRKLEIA